MATKPARRYFTPEEVDAGLMMLAFCGGNSGEASRRLKEQGYNLSDRVLRKFRSTTYPERYAELHRTRAQEIEDVIVTKMRETALQAADVQQRALEKTVEQLDNGELRDASTAARNAAVVQGIATDKLLTLTGRPTTVVEHRDAEDVLRGLAQRFPGLIVEGTAEEDPAPELPEAA